MRYSTLFAFVLLPVLAAAQSRIDTFDRDPNWDGHNNRPVSEPRTVVQDFGYSPSGEIGGTITPDGHAAYYAKKLAQNDQEVALHASGTLRIERGGGNVLVGFFNSRTINEWRTPNTIAFRINGRGETFHAHVEYATSKWRAGAGIVGRYDRETDRNFPVENPSGATYRWSLDYNPTASDGSAAINATLNDHRVEIRIPAEHRADGMSFDRFGLLNVIKSVDGPAQIWIADLVINGERVDLTKDPRWDARDNRGTYQSTEVRPRFDFGYSATNHAGGAAAGEIGGLFFRGDCRYPEKLAYYGATLDPLTLARPLRASGKVVLLRGVSDSTTLFGFFHSEHSVAVNPSQQFGLPMDFLGFSIEGPSAEGFYAYPSYRLHGGDQGVAAYKDAPRIYPDGTPHSWTLEFTPGTPSGSLTFTLDGQSVNIAVSTEEEGHFDRIGLVTPWIDGNGQVVYFDDIEYTARQE